MRWKKSPMKTTVHSQLKLYVVYVKVLRRKGLLFPGENMLQFFDGFSKLILMSISPR